MKTLLLDVSNLCWTCLHIGKDREFGQTIQVDGKPVHVNSASHGFEQAVAFLAPLISELGLVPRDIIFVEETGAAREFRALIFADYKHKLSGKGKADEAYVEFNKMKALLRAAFLPLGAKFVTQEGVEADDIIAYLALALPESIIISTDVDMQACISAKSHLWHKGRIDENRIGPFPVQYTTLYKALVGDQGDNIKGAKGFGDRAFLDLYAMFGDEGCDMMTDLIKSRTLEKLSEDVGALKSLQRIIDDRNNVYMCWDLAALYPERVNTMRRPLVWTFAPQKVGSVVDPRLAQWAPKQKLVHAGNYEASLQWFANVAAVSPFIAFDIETSVPEESAEWLANRSKKSNAEDGARTGVDVLASQLTGGSFTLGDNGQFTLYMGVNHDESDGLKNITVEQAAEFIKVVPPSTVLVVQNASFELSVLERMWAKSLGDNGWHGFLPNVHDTKLMASHVNENISNGLKGMSRGYMGYEQVSYKDVTTVGGVHREMNKLSATHVANYGADDAICTSALYHHFRAIMRMEGSWNAYLATDTKPPYIISLAFNQGAKVSMQKLKELEVDDATKRDAAWQVARGYLIERGWAGTICPVYTAPIDAAQIKEAYGLVTGGTLETKVRTPAKLVAIVRSLHEAAETGIVDSSTELAGIILPHLDAAVKGNCDSLNALVKLHFKGEPEFKFNSPKQLTHLYYDKTCLNLPIRLRNKATDQMRAAKIYEGNPTTDALAMEYALKYDVVKGSEEEKICKAIQAIKSIDTRQSLFYTPYPFHLHWQSGMIHSGLNQSQTNTRRWTASGPNVQQLPKNAKYGEPARFREVFVPHHKDAVIVSLDFSSQELCLIADYSGDLGMLSCYVGNSKQDMHSMTGVGILKKRLKSGSAVNLLLDAGVTRPLSEVIMEVLPWEPRTLKSVAGDKASDLQQLAFTYRATGKKVNFTTEFGALAPKLARTLLSTVEEAQDYIDAKLEAFPRADAWKKEVIAESKLTGYSYSKLGGVRHLGPAFQSKNSYEALKAERQAVNFKIQGSGAEQTKLAMTKVWDSGVLYSLDARFLFPVHDEVVFSVAVVDLVEFLSRVYPLMVERFADMTFSIESSVSIGPNFGEQHDLDDVTPATINAMLLQLGYSVPAANDELEEVAA